MSEQLKKLVPQRRFPAFQDTKVWELSQFSEVYNLHTTNSYSREMLNYENGSVKNIHYGDIHTKFQTLFDITKETVPFINPSESLEKIKPENYCVESDMVFADASEDLADVGKSIEIVNLNGEPLLSGLHTLLARQIDNKLVIGFGGHLFKSSGIRKQIQKESQGAKVLGISGGRLSGIKIYYPSDKAEQQKIADCLSSLDDLITAQNQKIEALKQHKKGLMQQLFPAEGETVPKLRFIEFENDTEWRNLNLIDIAKTSIGLVTTMTTSYSTKGVPLIRNSDIQQNKVRKEELIYLLDSFADKYPGKKLRTGDIVTVHTGDIGVSSLIDSELNGCLGFATLNTRVIKNDVLPEYLCWYFNSERYISFAMSMATGDGRNNFNLSDFNRSVIPMPTKSEQQKIADCLSSLDDLITTQTQQLEAYKAHKKGLMQQLFPSLDEV